MAQVHTAYGPGEIIGTSTVRGRTEYRVAGNGFDVWIDEAKLGGVREADAWGANPGDNHPDDPMTPFSHLGDEDPYADEDPFEGSRMMEHYQEEPHSFGRPVDAPAAHRHEEYWTPEEMSGLKDRAQDPAYQQFMNEPIPHAVPDYQDLHHGHRQAWAPMDNDNSVALPYDPTPQYPAIPGDTESTLQPIHEIDADERLSPADSISFEDRGDDESELEPTGPNFADRQAGWQHNPEMGQSFGGGGSNNPHGLGAGDPEWSEFGYHDPRYDDDEATGATEHEGSTVHDAFAFLIPLAEGLAGAAGGGAAAGAAEGGMASAMGGGLARGVGQGAAMNALGGGGEGGQQDPGMADQLVNATSPGEGWGELQRGAALNSWLADQDSGENGPRRLDARYIDIESSVDYHNDPVAQFRHDPVAYIERVGHVYDEPASQHMAHYGELVESDPSIREAAWADVRTKAMRLRREGRVAVKDVSPDRIYATVQGDHGTYDVMIVKAGAFGGFGGGHSISNWRCACEWGKWAFQRRLTYVGRLCSHGYAAYMEMQSAHVKGQPRQPKLTRPYTKKRADALQNVPQRLVPDLVINDSEDSQQFLDVTKDERDDTGPGDVVQDEDIVHFARVLTACDQNDWPYPQELVAFLVRRADDQTTQDWKVEDTGKAGPALEEIRDWADTPQPEDWGHMDERNDDIRDAIDTARENGVDASQLVAFRTAAPGDGGQPRDINDMMGVGAPAPTPISPQTDVRNPATFPGVQGGPNTTGPGAAAASGQENSAPNGYDPTGGLMSAPYGGGAPAAGGGGVPNTSGATPAPGSDVSPTRGENRTSNPEYGGSPAGQPDTITGDPGSDNANGGGGGGGQIGQGEYQIQSGDTLSDIAQRSGYGGDYNSLAQQNNISDPNKINAGGTLNIGKPEGGGNPDQAGVSQQENAPQATDNPATNAPGGPLNQNSGGLGADDVNSAANTNPGLNNPAAPASNPAQTGSNPATPSTGSGVDMSAIPGASGGGGGIDTGAAAAPAASNPATDTSSENGGAGSASDSNPGSGGAGSSDVMSGVSDALGTVKSFLTGRNLFADQGDYEEWVRYAYPDSKDRDHKPFNGSGNPGPLEIGTSEEYADKARKKADDVTDLDYDITKDVNPKQGNVSSIKRAGSGPRRHVEPVVVREQKVTKGGHQTIEASLPDFADFDPLAPRTAASFDDPYAEASNDAAAQMIAANTEGDIVTAFQRSAGAQAVMSNSRSSASDNFDIAGAAAGFLQKTAGRNYSPAEQHELIREGDIGGAGNLGSLQLAGTHYVEDESKNSVGLW